MKDDDFAGLIASLESRGRTRTEIARAAGISRQTLWRIATGQAREPGFDTIERLRRLDRSAAAAVTPMLHKIR